MWGRGVKEGELCEGEEGRSVCVGSGGWKRV